MAQPLVIHIGYHKTATTWMQRLLFTPEHGYRQIADHGDVFRHIVQPHGLSFDPEDMRALIAERLAPVGPAEVPVISSEILSGHPFFGGHGSDVYAERLARIAPGARILISIRAQLRILPSVYMQYVLRGGTMPWQRFFDGTEEPGYFGFSPRHFEYDLLVAQYQRLFGAQNVHVLTQESLSADMDAAALRVAEFAGNTGFTTLAAAARRVDAPSYPEFGAPLLRRLNHVQSSTLNPWPILSLGRTPKGLYKGAGYLLKRKWVRGMMSGRKPVSDHVRERFAGCFDDSNARLAALVPHPLDLSGYN
ncbi:hypothetical protein [Puniceibacterium sediminis]|uniref:Sulfotransferase family protein n=1 Tax=Puniceibacterium sediminis TaxID=1608407 RepID=A0A238YLV7_9RHOB|nr:hypothetical protein [Puniceibacterium sediminis]SNR72030.1 hypothetical protein SAMN06265370_11826 [Puniceibacterium sediminis]